MAVITSWCGTPRPACRLKGQPLVHAETCCSSTMASAGSWNATPSCISMRATTTCAVPSATSSSADSRALPVTLPASQHPARPAVPASRAGWRKCCSASQFGRRHQRGLQALLHREQRVSRRPRSLPLPTSPAPAAASGAAAPGLRHLRVTRLRRGQREDGSRAAQPTDNPSPVSACAPSDCNAIRCRRRLPAGAPALLVASRPLRANRLQDRQVHPQAGLYSRRRPRAVEAGSSSAARMPGAATQCVARGRTLQGQPISDAGCRHVPSISGYTGSGRRQGGHRHRRGGEKPVRTISRPVGQGARCRRRTRVPGANCAACCGSGKRGTSVPARFVGQRDPQHRPVAEAALHRLHLPLDLRRRGLQPADRRQRGPVLVAARQVQPGSCTDQAAGGKLLAQRRATAEAGQRAVGRREGVGRATGIRTGYGSPREAPASRRSERTAPRRPVARLADRRADHAEHPWCRRTAAGRSRSGCRTGCWRTRRRSQRSCGERHCSCTSVRLLTRRFGTP